MLRIILLFFIIFAFVTQFFVPALLVMLFYMFRYTAYEVIVLAILIDGYYGGFYSFPLLSIVTVIAWFVIDILKPYLLMYTERNEMVS